MLYNPRSSGPSIEENPVENVPRTRTQGNVPSLLQLVHNPKQRCCWYPACLISREEESSCFAARLQSRESSCLQTKSFIIGGYSVVVLCPTMELADIQDHGKRQQQLFVDFGDSVQSRSRCAEKQEWGRACWLPATSEPGALAGLEPSRRFKRLGLSADVGPGSPLLSCQEPGLWSARLAVGLAKAVQLPRRNPRFNRTNLQVVRIRGIASGGQKPDRANSLTLAPTFIRYITAPYYIRMTRQIASHIAPISQAAKGRVAGILTG